MAGRPVVDREPAGRMVCAMEYLLAGRAVECSASHTASVSDCAPGTPDPPSGPAPPCPGDRTAGAR
ncbi:hypothetical protein GCM10010498_01920 [Streptomyces cavourensis]|nr:hypothetical protein GCM10010498_01920 [Streptomyces cavourensis]